MQWDACMEEPRKKASAMEDSTLSCLITKGYIPIDSHDQKTSSGVLEKNGHCCKSDMVVQAGSVKNPKMASTDNAT